MSTGLVEAATTCYDDWKKQKLPIALTFDFNSLLALLQGRQSRLQLAEQISEGDCSRSSQQLDHFSNACYATRFPAAAFLSTPQNCFALPEIISDPVTHTHTHIKKKGNCARPHMLIHRGIKIGGWTELRNKSMPGTFHSWLLLTNP